MRLRGKIIHVLSSVHPVTVLVFLFAFAFSSWLMFHTFSYDPKTQSIQIAFKLWSDFGAHIPLIRSFSMGDNLERLIRFDVQYPIFPGEPIRYHFMFYLLVGILEKIGVRIDWALNLPSIIGFTGLLFGLYYLTKVLTSSRFAGILSIVFFLFNGSFGFLRFFQIQPVTDNILSTIMAANNFPAFAPWGPGDITAFWNLNIYTNQRHLALALSIVIGFILWVYRMEKRTTPVSPVACILWALVFGLFPFFHQPALLIVAIVLASYIICFPRLRAPLLSIGLLTAALVLPQLSSSHDVEGAVSWYPGYIIHNELGKIPGVFNKLARMADFWWANIGLHALLFPVGIWLLPKKARYFLLPVLPIFIIPNLVKFSVEASANHKFFNFAMMLASIGTANFFAYVIQSIRASRIVVLNVITAIGLVIMLVFLTLSGVIDFFVVKNDVVGSLKDWQVQDAASWVARNTSKDAVFLNSNYLYHPASLAGRAIFLGWPYFAWSAGYKENRMPIMNIMYETNDAKTRCGLFNKYSIDYITVEEIKDDKNLPRIDLARFLTAYTPAYVNADRTYAIFTYETLCPDFKKSSL